MSDDHRPGRADGTAASGQLVVSIHFWGDSYASVASAWADRSRYGVSRVYLEQCGYVLSDAENAHNSMRLMLNIMRNSVVDPEAGRAR